MKRELCPRCGGREWEVIPLGRGTKERQHNCVEVLRKRIEALEAKVQGATPGENGKPA